LESTNLITRPSAKQCHHFSPSAGIDEVPMVYKNIHDVMAAQKDLVTVFGQFHPKLVKMVPHGEDRKTDVKAE